MYMNSCGISSASICKTLIQWKTRLCSSAYICYTVHLHYKGYVCSMQHHRAKVNNTYLHILMLQPQPSPPPWIPPPHPHSSSSSDSFHFGWSQVNSPAAFVSCLNLIGVSTIKQSCVCAPDGCVEPVGSWGGGSFDSQCFGIARRWHLDILLCLMYTSVFSVLQSLCVLFCNKCEADIVLMVVQIGAHVLLLECKVLIIV